MELSEKLKIIRRESGLTQQEMANKLSISRQAISNYEQGRGYPSLDTLKSISSLFNVSLDELLSSEAVSRRAKYVLIAVSELIAGIIIVLIAQYFIFKRNVSSWVQPVFFVCLFSVPLLCTFFGVLFAYFPPRKINFFFGFRTKLSMKNKTLWNYAQSCCSTVFLLAAIIALGLTEIFFIVSVFIGLEAMIYIGTGIMVLQILAVVAPALYVGRKLKGFAGGSGKEKK